MKAILSLALALLALPLVSAATVHEKPVVKVGVICPLSGNAAAHGEELRAALQVAQEDLANAKFRYELIFEDDQMNPARSAQAAQKLIKVDKIDALISFGSGPGNVIAPIAEAARVPFIGICSDPNVAKGKYNFIHWTPPEKEVAKFVPELVKRRIKSVGIIEQNHQGWLYTSNLLVPALEKNGIRVTSRQKFNFGERDFRMYLAKAAEAKPDALYLAAFSPEAEILQKQYNDAKLRIPYVSIVGPDLAQDTKPFEGVWYVSGTATPDALARRIIAKSAIKKMFFGGFGYDALSFIAQACEKLGAGGVKPTGTQIVEDLQKLEGYTSVFGALGINAEGVFQTEPTIKQIRNGEPVVVQ
jgi:branched-chain amino acid transport system substrate-binding protein